MSFRRLATHGMLCASLFVHAPVEAANVCAHSAEHRALDVRMLQTELMVAALTCGYQRDYNAIVTSLKPMFAAEATALRGYFARRYGSNGTRELDRFVTRLANEESIRSNADRAGYCAARRVLVARLRTEGGLALADTSLRKELAGGHRIDLCGTPGRAAGGQERRAAATGR